MVLTSGLEIDTYLKQLEDYLDAPKNDDELFAAIVNAPFTDRRRTTLMGLGIVVFLLVNKKTKNIDRVALADTELAKGTETMSVKPFAEIKIPLNYHGNFIAEAIRSGRYQCTSDWRYLFAPALTPEEARLNQAGGGISCSFIYPLIGARDGGAMIFSYFITMDKVDKEHKDFMFRYAKLVSKFLNKKP